MFKNYLKTALRNFIRFKGYTFINILGLSLGLSCCILILLYTLDEVSYDRFHVNGDRIYRIVEKYPDGGKIHYHPRTPAPLADALKNEFPGEFKVIRLAGENESIITYGNVETRSNFELLADPNVFDIFTIPLIKGNPKNVLNDSKSIVISEKLAKKYFGDRDPVGSTLSIGPQNYQSDYKVTGIFKDLPHNSSLQFDYITSFQTQYVKGNEGNLSWGGSNYSTYILFPAGYKPELLEAKLSSLIKKYNADAETPGMEFCLQPLKDIHLSLKPGYELPTDKDNEQFFIFLSISVLILLAACINFINLSTARASIREKEVGVRKAAGARRFQLVKQFLGESLIMAILALLLSIPIIEILLPVFNQYTNKELALFSQSNGLLLVYAIMLALIVGALAGIYPALYVSSFKPISILKGRLLSEKNNNKAGLRKILVTTQFVIAIFFITCALVMYNQLKYVRSKDLGYNKEHLVVIPILERQIKEKYETYKTEILRSRNVLNVTATSYLPSEQGYRQNLHLKDANEDALSMIDWMTVDYSFIKTMGIKLTKGRDFSEEFSTDKYSAYILNESAAKQIGWKNPIGGQMDIIGWGSVVGVVKDFNFQSLHQQIVPMALCIFPEGYRYMLVRIKKEDIPGSVRFLEDKWKEVYPNQAFEYSFFDKDFDKLYKSEIVFGSIINFITCLALIVACLGLLGLVHFSTERRSKEIGIRKVAGASVMNILILITKDFVKWIIMANIIAVPVVYYLMNKWLQDFAYRINIDWLTFVLAGGSTLIIALAAISFRSIKAARLNPVESLRYE